MKLYEAIIQDGPYRLHVPVVEIKTQGGHAMYYRLNAENNAGHCHPISLEPMRSDRAKLHGGLLARFRGKARVENQGSDK